jgi:hypothetical protein
MATYQTQLPFARINPPVRFLAQLDFNTPTKDEDAPTNDEEGDVFQLE